MIKEIFSFPNPVNENAARTVAFCVVVLAIAGFITNSIYILSFLLYGFIARVLTGPTLSPIGQFATRIIAPNLPKKNVAGPPKRFAQMIGLVCSSLTLYLFIVEQHLLSDAILSLLLLFASLEAFVGFCAGCFIFNKLMKIGLVPESICEQCQI
ncbi:MAG: DUF4395 domain-containing protein [Dehalococcoidia bacterium]|jgi:uncharacterized membrane protein required for colicin V production|tara:strand:- start:300 stop:761 length:462 start_codon:yes stop_codon:yes gene_type:complete